MSENVKLTYNLDWLQQKFDNGDKLKYLFFWGHTQPREKLWVNFYSANGLSCLL